MRFNFSLQALFYWVISLSALFIINISCVPGIQDKQWDKIISVKWVHSHEDDENGIQAFRKSNYDFPPSRGRRGFQLLPKNIFINYEIAPSDGIIEREGSWMMMSDGSCKVTFSDAPGKNFTFEIVSYKKSLLKIKTIN